MALPKEAKPSHCIPETDLFYNFKKGCKTIRKYIIITKKITNPKYKTPVPLKETLVMK